MAEKEPRVPRRAHVRAVPWKTPTEEKVKGALGEVPAYIRRLVRLERTLEALYSGAEAGREELLGWVVLRLRQAEPFEGEFSPRTASAIDRIRESVRELPAYRRLKPRLETRTRGKDVARALDLLRTSVRRFNDAFERWIEEEALIDEVNSQIDGYNRHFRFERQCAIRHVPIDKLRFERLDPVSREEILARYPLLPMP